MKLVFPAVGKACSRQDRLIASPKIISMKWPNKDSGFVCAALADVAVVSAPAAGGGTPSGRHQALRVSVSVASRDELETLDRVLRAVPGVRMIL